MLRGLSVAHERSPSTHPWAVLVIPLAAATPGLDQQQRVTALDGAGQRWTGWTLQRLHHGRR